MWPSISFGFDNPRNDNPLLYVQANSPLEQAASLSEPSLRFQYAASDHGGLSITVGGSRSPHWVSPLFRPVSSFSQASSNIQSCRNPREFFDFSAVNENGPPTAPSINCFKGNLPNQTGWFDSRLHLQGLTRVALTFRPDAEISRARPLVILLHGTGGGSDSMSHDLFNQDEAHRIFQNDAIIFILEARDMMPPDWEHPDSHHTLFWNTTEDNGSRNVDILFIQALIREAISSYGADASRVFLFGHSNGGFAATHYGIALRHQIRGVIVSSAGWVEHPPKRHMTFQSTQCSEILRLGLSTMTRNLSFWSHNWEFPFIHHDTSNNLYPHPRPVTRFPTDGRPAFFIRGNALDPDVSAYYSCALEQQLRINGYTEVQTQIINTPSPERPEEGYHFIDRKMVIEGWRWAMNMPTPE